MSAPVHPVQCVESWSKESLDPDTTILILSIMVAIVILANIAVLVTIFTSEELRKKVNS